MSKRFPGNSFCVVFSLPTFQKMVSWHFFCPSFVKILFHLAKDIRLKVTSTSFEDNKGIMEAYTYVTAVALKSVVTFAMLFFLLKEIPH